MHLKKLTDDERADALRSLPNWEVVNEKLHREYKFPDFVHAFGFMTASALEIEKMNHHPEWQNVYGRVVVDLTTHDSSGITENDVKLAKLLDGLASKLQ